MRGRKQQTRTVSAFLPVCCSVFVSAAYNDSRNTVDVVHFRIRDTNSSNSDFFLFFVAENMPQLHRCYNYEERAGQSSNGNRAGPYPLTLCCGEELGSDSRNKEECCLLKRMRLTSQWRSASLGTECCLFVYWRLIYSPAQGHLRAFTSSNLKKLHFFFKTFNYNYVHTNKLFFLNIRF